MTDSKKTKPKTKEVVNAFHHENGMYEVRITTVEVKDVKNTT